MQVVRTQWPIGQGCFSTGAIAVNNAKPLHYVYDCGARNVSGLESVVAAYADSVSGIDALFVSHLDGDHVDGLDTLLAQTKVKTVYLPYLSEINRFMLLIEAATEEGRFTASLVQVHFDPARWFGDRGAERVVLLRNSGRGPVRDSVVPPEPSDRPDGEVAIQLEAPIRFKESGTVVRKRRSTPTSMAELSEMKVGSTIGVCLKDNLLNWVLVPYVPKVSTSHHIAFEAKLREVFCIPANTALDFGKLLSALKSPEGRKKLRSCYDEIVVRGGTSAHNRVSLSLYSGPAKLAVDQLWATKIRFGGAFPFGRWLFDRSSSVGWIGAGDFGFKHSKQRDAWFLFYEKLLRQVRTLLLPHHGSAHNFHEELLSPPGLEFYIAAADDREAGYKHPSASVVNAIEEAKRHVVHVSKERMLKFVETIND